MKPVDFEQPSGPQNAGSERPTRRTPSPAPVAPSISSMTTRTGFELPIAAPDSRAGRILSSTTVPERASLTHHEGVSPPHQYLESNHKPRIDLENLVSCLLCDDMCQRRLSQAGWPRNQQQLINVRNKYAMWKKHNRLTFSRGRRYSSKYCPSSVIFCFPFDFPNTQ